MSTPTASSIFTAPSPAISWICSTRTTRAGFCVIAQDRICPERYTTFYQSVVLRGRVRIVEQPDEKMDAVRKLCARYVPLDSPQSHQQTIDKEWSSLCILCFEIEQMSGKQALELCQ